MQEPRKKLIKKGSISSLQRKARRQQRLRWVSTAPEHVAPEPPASADRPQSKNQQSVIIDLAWRTVALLHRNMLIQQKILDLQKETSEFVSSVLNSPEKKQQYLEYVEVCKTARLKAQQNKETNPTIKLDSKT